MIGLCFHSQGRVRMTGKMGRAGWGRENNLSGCHSYPKGNGLTGDEPSVVLLPSMAMTGSGVGWGWVEILSLWANQKATKLCNTPATSRAVVYMVHSPGMVKAGVL